MRNRLLFICVALGFFAPSVVSQGIANRITILYDAFGKNPALEKDWGFSALVEYDGRRILFDTGNNAEIFQRNVETLGVDLTRLDFVVISHRHADHISGISYVLKQNPRVKIYTPKEPFGLFGGSFPSDFYKHVETLPGEMRYFGGTPKDFRSGTPWPEANFIPVDTVTELAPGISVVPTISNVPGTLELRELTLSIRTPKGQILVDGCSHAGIEKILEATSALDAHIYEVFGGLHLVKTPYEEIQRISVALHDKWKVERIAPGHCTGEPAFAALQKVYGPNYIYAGLGTVIPLS
jgi:7,8-dihydropterin-6-yl-methyl-4-(beta-D-ribofuranosyl)aminobenzene 5'-phosphate synthase